MKLNLKLTSLLLGTCVLTGSSASASDPHDYSDGVVGDHRYGGFSSYSDDSDYSDDAETARAAAEATLKATEAALVIATGKLAAAEAAHKAAEAAHKAAEAAHKAAEARLKDSEVFKDAINAREALTDAERRLKNITDEVERAKNALSKEESAVTTETGCKVCVENFAEREWNGNSFHKFLEDVHNNKSDAIIFVGSSEKVDFWSQNKYGDYEDNPPSLKPRLARFRIGTQKHVGNTTDCTIYQVTLRSLGEALPDDPPVNVMVYKGWDHRTDTASNPAAFIEFLNNMEPRYKNVTLLHVGPLNSIKVEHNVHCPLSISYIPLPAVLRIIPRSDSDLELDSDSDLELDSDSDLELDF